MPFNSTAGNPNTGLSASTSFSLRYQDSPSITLNTQFVFGPPPRPTTTVSYLEFRANGQFEVLAGSRIVDVVIIGGGGGGGGGSGGGYANGAGGGGACGNCSTHRVRLDPGLYVVTVGAGGSAGTGRQGQSGTAGGVGTAGSIYMLAPNFQYINILGLSTMTSANPGTTTWGGSGGSNSHYSGGQPVYEGGAGGGAGFASPGQNATYNPSTQTGSSGVGGTNSFIYVGVEFNYPRYVSGGGGVGGWDRGGPGDLGTGYGWGTGTPNGSNDYGGGGGGGGTGNMTFVGQNGGNGGRGMTAIQWLQSGSEQIGIFSV